MVDRPHWFFLSPGLHFCQMSASSQTMCGRKSETSRGSPRRERLGQGPQRLVNFTVAADYIGRGRSLPGVFEPVTDEIHAAKENHCVTM